MELNKIKQNKLREEIRDIVFSDEYIKEQLSFIAFDLKCFIEKNTGKDVEADITSIDHVLTSIQNDNPFYELIQNIEDILIHSINHVFEEQIWNEKKSAIENSDNFILELFDFYINKIGKPLFKLLLNIKGDEIRVLNGRLLSAQRNRLNANDYSYKFYQKIITDICFDRTLNIKQAIEKNSDKQSHYDTEKRNFSTFRDNHKKEVIQMIENNLSSDSKRDIVIQLLYSKKNPSG